MEEHMHLLLSTWQSKLTWNRCVGVVECAHKTGCVFPTLKIDPVERRVAGSHSPDCLQTSILSPRQALRVLRVDYSPIPLLRQP